MGSVGLGNNPLLGAFQNKINPEGLDLGRCSIESALGVYVADPASTFRAGMLVMRNSSGLVVASNGLDVLGVAKWNHTLTMFAAVADEQVVLPGTTTVSLAHALVANVKVSLTAGGAALTAGTDYDVVSLTNGTIARHSGGAISDGATVFVSYTYQIPQLDLLQFQGQNFWNNLDEVSQAENRCTVITAADLLFTTQYDTAQQYTLTGATSDLYAATGGGLAGLFTSSSAGSAKFVGRVFQVPTASDPYLGVRLVRNPVSV